MNRLTSDKTTGEMNNIELAFNCCVSEEGRAVYRDFGSSTDARELTRKLLDAYGVECFCIETDEDFDELMLECLMDGMFTPSGLIAIVYRFIWAMAEMRSRLKRYEDTGLDPEQLYKMDRLYTEQCKELVEARKELQYGLKVGDILYFACYDSGFPDQSEVSETVVKDISKNGLILVDEYDTWINWQDPSEELFRTKEEAEARLKEIVRNCR